MFNKGLKTDKKQEGLLKKLENIEDKTDNQLKEIQDEDTQSGSKSIGYTVRNRLPKEAVKIFNNLVERTKLLIIENCSIKVTLENIRLDLLFFHL